MTVPHDPKLNGRDWYAAFCNSSEAHVRVAGELRTVKAKLNQERIHYMIDCSVLLILIGVVGVACYYAGLNAG